MKEANKVKVHEEAVTFVIFGGTGDLCIDRLIPAIIRMSENGKIHKDAMVAGVGRKEFTDDEYKKFLYDSIKKKPSEDVWEKLNIKYFMADFSADNPLDGMKEFLNKIEKMTYSDRIYYFAVSYKYFGRITSQLKKYDLHSGSKCFRRVVYEKPFGHNLKSSDEIDKCIHSVFDEKDVYRIDHYLGKETVQNILVFRFSNPIFERMWNSRFIEKIKIISNENAGVEDRIEYYDMSGAIRDMVQNHLLQLVSLMLMESPKSLDPDDVHNKKIEVLKTLEFKGKDDIITGQYESYKDELKKNGMKENSKTETFVKLRLFSNMGRWKGVPVILGTGKKLADKYAKIIVEFKKEPCILYCSPFTSPNILTINIQPTQDITFEFNVKKPGANYDIEKVKLEFCHDCHFGPNSSETYEKLLNDVVKGDRTLFARFDEVRESWKIVDKVERAKKNAPLKIYKPGDTGEYYFDKKMRE